MGLAFSLSAWLITITFRAYLHGKAWLATKPEGRFISETLYSLMLEIVPKYIQKRLGTAPSDEVCDAE